MISFVDDRIFLMRRLLPLPVLPSLAVTFSLLLIWIALIMLGNPVSLDDGLRHFAMARLMMEQGIGAADWSQFFSYGYFAHHSVDPWFLSNLAFIPLLPFGPVLALKIFVIASIALLIASFLYTFHSFQTPRFVAAICIGLLLFFEPTFFYRSLLGRPFSFITPLAVVIIVATLRKQSILICIALALSVLLSQVFIFPLLIAFACVFWRLSLRQWWEASALFSWSLFGIFLGFFFHPHSSQYFFYILDTFVRIPFIAGMQLGPEMQSGLFASSRVFVMLTVILLLHGGLIRKKIAWHTYQETGLSALSFLTFFFLFLFFLWARAIDFLWPIAILFLVRLLSLYPGLFTETLRSITPKRFIFRPTISVLIVLLLCSSSFFAVAKELVKTDGDRTLSIYEDALRAVPSGSNVLNVDWHFFMGAVVVRSDLQYATGIDPSYTYLDSPEALLLLASLNTPKFQQSPTDHDVRAWLQNIVRIHPSDYLVLFRKGHEAVIDRMERGLFMKDLSMSRSIAVFELDGSGVPRVESASRFPPSHSRGRFYPRIYAYSRS